MKAIVFHYLFSLSLIIALPLAFLAPPSPAGTAQVGQWQELHPPHSPPARYGHSMVALNGTVYVFGGMVSGQYGLISAPNWEPVNDLWRWDDGNDWELLNPTPAPPARVYHTAVASRGKMYVFFGLGQGGTALSDVWSYDPTTNSWQQETPAGGDQPAARYHHSTTATNDGPIYVFGGVGSDGFVIDDYHIWKYDPSARTWEKKKAAPVVYYGQSMATSATGEVYMFGGFGASTSSNETWSYSPEQDEWEKLSPAGTLPPPKAFYGAAFLGDYWWIFGGEGEWLFGNRRERSYLGGSWTLPVVALGFPVPTGGSDTWEYNFATNTWRQGANAPIASSLMKAAPIPVLSGLSGLGPTRILTFGGMSGGAPIDRTFMYIPLEFRVWLPYVSR